MIMDTNQIITMTEANQNFSKVVKIAEKNGSAIIFKNNKPRYMIVDLNSNPMMELSDDEKIDVVAKRILNQHKSAFEKLGK